MPVKGLYCEACERPFGNLFNYERHLSSAKCKSHLPFQCRVCQKVFTRKYNFESHIKSAHPIGVQNRHFKCGLCSSACESEKELQKHREKAHAHHTDFKLVKSAHARQALQLRAFLPDGVNTIDECLMYTYDQVSVLAEVLGRKSPTFRLNLFLYVDMYKIDLESQELITSEMFPFPSIGIDFNRYRMKEFANDLARSCGDIERAIDQFLHRGSGWFVKRGVMLEAQVVAYNPLSGNAICKPHTAKFGGVSGITICPDGKTVAAGGQLCFYKAIAQHFVEGEEIEPFIEKEMRDVQRHGSVDIREIDAFERKNGPSLDLAINIIYQDEMGKFMPVRASKRLEAKNQICLTLFYCREEGQKEKKEEKKGEEEERVNLTNHYSYIRNPELLFGTRTYNKETGGVSKTRKTFICFNCFTTRSTLNAHETHIEFCHRQDCQRIKMPRVGEKKSFVVDEQKHAKIFQSAFLLAYDFESMQQEVTRSCSCPSSVLKDTAEPEEALARWARENSEREGEYSQEWIGDVFDAISKGKKPPLFPRGKGGTKIPPPRFCQHKTKVLCNQPPISYGLCLFNREGEVLERKTYAGADAADNFIMTVLNLADKWLPKLSPGRDMESLSQEEKATLYERDTCYLCQIKFKPGEKKCLDHDHLTGHLLGIAHNDCNLMRREQHQITAFCHNFSGELVLNLCSFLPTFRSIWYLFTCSVVLQLPC